MKTNFLLLILIIIPSLVFSQTIELEKEHLNKVIQSGKLDQKELKTIGNAWYKLLKDFGGYPELPYNLDLEKIEYIRIDTFEGIAKKDIYKGVKEYIAINYGSIKDVLHYEDFDSGKIIVKGWNDLLIEDILKTFWGNPKEVVKSLKCYHTIVFTIKEGRMKTEYTNLEYESYSPGYFFSPTIYIPPTITKYSIKELYPVTNKHQSTWVSRLSTLKNTSIQIKNVQQAIKRIIMDSIDENNF